MKKILLTTCAALAFCACGGKTATENPLNSSQASNKPILQPVGAAESPMPMPTPVVPKDGTYKGHGTVTRVSNDLGSIEIEHDDIPGLMPAMKMEFYVKDKAMLNGIFANDEINFVIEYKQAQEKIASITKVKKAKKGDE
jgi:Cu/Ag efflux protein CusF